MFRGVNFSKRFADIKAGDPIGTSHLKANRWLHAPDNCLNEIPFVLRNIIDKGARIQSIFCDNGPAVEN
jgi:hypothetical protein